MDLLKEMQIALMINALRGIGILAGKAAPIFNDDIYKQLNLLFCVWTDEDTLRKVQLIGEEMHLFCLPSTKKHEENIEMTEQMVRVWEQAWSKFND